MANDSTVVVKQTVFSVRDGTVENEEAVVDHEEIIVDLEDDGTAEKKEAVENGIEVVFVDFNSDPVPGIHYFCEKSKSIQKRGIFNSLKNIIL